MKIFKRFRFDAIRRNKIANYLKYASGEIILVVVGILIALSINNWNEGVKLRQAEIDILEGIRQNILVDTVDLGHNLGRFEEMNERDTIILNRMINKEGYSALVEDKISDLWRSNITLTLHTGYFDEAKSKGLSLITNKPLRDSISRLYEFRYALILHIENSSSQYDYLSEYEELNKDNLFIDENGQLIVGEDQYNELLENKFFTWKLLSANIKMRTVSAYYKNAYSSALEVVAAIDRELVK